jgi:hypothetical protein
LNTADGIATPQTPPKLRRNPHVALAQRRLDRRQRRRQEDAGARSAQDLDADPVPGGRVGVEPREQAEGYRQQPDPDQVEGPVAPQFGQAAAGKNGKRNGRDGAG